LSEKTNKRKEKFLKDNPDILDIMSSPEVVRKKKKKEYFKNKKRRK
jgi:hypothetical protein